MGNRKRGRSVNAASNASGTVTIDIPSVNNPPQVCEDWPGACEGGFSSVQVTATPNAGCSTKSVRVCGVATGGVPQPEDWWPSQDTLVPNVFTFDGARVAYCGGGTLIAEAVFENSQGAGSPVQATFNYAAAAVNPNCSASARVARSPSRSSRTRGGGGGSGPHQLAKPQLYYDPMVVNLFPGGNLLMYPLATPIRPLLGFSQLEVAALEVDWKPKSLVRILSPKGLPQRAPAGWQFVGERKYSIIVTQNQVTGTMVDSVRPSRPTIVNIDPARPVFVQVNGKRPTASNSHPYSAHTGKLTGGAGFVLWVRPVP